MIQFDYIFVYIYIHMNINMFQIGWFNHQLENPSTLVTLGLVIMIPKVVLVVSTFKPEGKISDGLPLARDSRPSGKWNFSGLLVYVDRIFSRM